MSDAQAIIDDLKAQGFDSEQILAAMQDGEYLKSEGISQETAERVHATINKATN